MYSYAPEKGKTAPCVKKEIKNKENPSHRSALAQFNLDFFRPKNSGSCYSEQPTRGEGGVCQLLSLAVQGEGEYPQCQGGRYQIKRYKRKGWHLFMGLQRIWCELGNDPLCEDITVRQALELPVDIEDLHGQLEAIADTHDLDLPLIRAGDYEEVQGDLGDPSCKSELLGLLGKEAHKLIEQNGLICGPHIAISFVGGWLYLAINTPNTKEIGMMIPADELVRYVLIAVDSLLEHVDPLNGEIEQYKYLLRLKAAIVEGCFSVIETLEAPASVQDHLGTMHAEMLIAEHLKSALAPERTEMVTVAKTRNAEGLQNDFLEPFDTRRRLLERGKRVPDGLRVIRFGGTLIDCGLCHAKFHGGRVKRGQGGSSLWRDGNRTDEIERNDAYDSFFEEYRSVVLSSAHGGRWHPGWRCGPLAMEMGSVGDLKSCERARLRDRRTQEAKLYEAKQLYEALQGCSEINKEEPLERIALLAGPKSELFQQFLMKASQERDSGKLLMAARVYLHTGDMSEEVRSGCCRLIFGAISESEKDKEIPEDMYRFLNLVLHDPHQTLWQRMLSAEDFAEIVADMVTPAMIQTNFGNVLDLIRFLTEYPDVNVDDIAYISNQVISIISENQETFMRRFCCLINLFKENEEYLRVSNMTLIEVLRQKGILCKNEELTALLSVMNLCGFSTNDIHNIFGLALGSASSIDDYVRLTQATLCLQSDLQGLLGSVVGEYFAQFILSNVDPQDYKALLYSLNNLAKLPLCEGSMRCIYLAARPFLDVESPVTYQLAFIEVLEEINGRQDEMTLLAGDILPLVHAAAERLPSFDDMLAYMESVLVFLYRLKSITGSDYINEFLEILYQKAVSTQFSEPEGIFNIFHLVELLEKYRIPWDTLHDVIERILETVNVFENYQSLFVTLPIILRIPGLETVLKVPQPTRIYALQNIAISELIDLMIKILSFKPLESNGKFMVEFFKSLIKRTVNEAPQEIPWLFELITSEQFPYRYDLYVEVEKMRRFLQVSTESS